MTYIQKSFGYIVDVYRTSNFLKDTVRKKKKKPTNEKKKRKEKEQTTIQR